MSVFRSVVALFAVGSLALACSSSSVTKGGGKSDANNAKTSSQKTGSKAAGSKTTGASKGSSVDGVACDSSLSGVGFCADDATIVFCDGEVWWGLSCPAVVSGGFCGYDTASSTVDCYAP